MSGLPQIHVLGLLDANGIRMNYGLFWPAPKIDTSRREHFQMLKANPKMTSYLDAPELGPVTGEWVAIEARPVHGKDGKFFGVVFASTAMKYFDELFRSTSIGEGYAITLLRKDGTLLTRYPMVGQIGMKVPASVLSALSDSRFGVSRSTSPVDGQARIAAAYSLMKYPLVVVVTQEENAAFAPWRRTAITMGIIAATMIGLIIIAAWLIARSWRQQERLNAARAEIIEFDKIRALAEAELNRQRDLAEQSRRFNAAVENMTQGLCMFDRDTRLVVCNDLYAKMYRLPAELLKPGTLHRDIIAHRVRSGVLKGGHGNADVQQQLSALSALPAKKKSNRIDEHADGKLIRVTRQPLPGGGWVATHDDITEQRRAEAGAVRDQAIPGFDHRQHSHCGGGEGRRHAQVRSCQSRVPGDARPGTRRARRQIRVRILQPKDRGIHRPHGQRGSRTAAATARTSNTTSIPRTARAFTRPAASSSATMTARRNI